MNRAERTAPSRPTDPSGMRSYEVHQRMRPKECAPITARQLWSPEFLGDPFGVLAVIREHHPAYRDWIGNTWWVTRYDDVTSVFVDDANFETLTKRWTMGLAHRGRDLRGRVAVQQAETDRYDADVVPLAEQIVASFRGRSSVDLATEFAARLSVALIGRSLGLGDDQLPDFARRWLRMHRGTGWDPHHRTDAVTAFDELAEFFDPLVATRRSDPGDDVISAIATLDLDDGPATGDDVAATLLEADHETLHGGLANLWWLLMRSRDEFEVVAAEPRLVKFAWLEMLRHSPPVARAARWTRHEVERFGLLLPAGAQVTCSALAANRDPRQFADPDRFDPTRKDLCQREPRGQYRADGLPAGVAFGLGAPSRFPAVPEDRPRSRYALVRDSAVSASRVLIDAFPELALVADAEPVARQREFGGMYACWSLPVVPR